MTSFPAIDVSFIRPSTPTLVPPRGQAEDVVASPSIRIEAAGGRATVGGTFAFDALPLCRCP